MNLLDHREALVRRDAARLGLHVTKHPGGYLVHDATDEVIAGADHHDGLTLGDVEVFLTIYSAVTQ